MSAVFSAAESFDCPDGFTAETISSQLYHEDVDEDSELWLIRMPYDVDPSKVENLKISLDGESKPAVFETEGEKVLECLADNNELPNIYLLLPSKSDGKLSDVKNVFKGSLLVTERTRLSTELSVKKEDENVFESNVSNNAVGYSKPPHRNKNVPFGSKVFSEEFHGLNYDTEEAHYEADVTPRSKKKHSKKHSKNESTLEVTDIKEEPQSSDMDDFPSCKSQN